MRPLRYSINVTLDGCCDHRAMMPDEETHRHATELIAQADALILGRLTYELMESAWREPARSGVAPDWMAEWMMPFCPRHRQGQEVCRVRHVVSCRLERGTHKVRRVGVYRRGAEAQAGGRVVRGRRGRPSRPGAGGVDRRVRVRRSPKAGGPWPHAIRGAVPPRRPTTGEPDRVRVGSGGDALRATHLTVQPGVHPGDRGSR